MAKDIVRLFVGQADMALKYAGNFPREDVSNDLHKLVASVEKLLERYEKVVSSYAGAAADAEPGKTSLKSDVSAENQSHDEPKASTGSDSVCY